MNKLKKMEEKYKDKTIVGICTAIISFVGMAYGNFYLSQYVLGLQENHLKPEVIRLNVLCILIVFTVIYAIGLKTKVSLILGTFIVLILSTANYYIYLFRGAELCPTDIMAVRTAINVAGNYKYTIGTNIWIPWVCFVMVVIGSCLLPECHWKKRWKPRVITTVITALMIWGFLFYSKEYEPKFWVNTGSLNNGYIFNFVLQLQGMHAEEPENYSVEEINEISEAFSSDKKVSTKKPDIIMIMDESFSDLRVHGIEPSTNQEITPFIDSLSENVVRGQMVVSSIGGGTCISEYESLTGNSHIFLQNVSSSYQQYVHGDVYSVVAEMKNMDYKCIGMHPYHASGWNRSFVYEHLGFDEAYFLEDFPQQNIIRNYVSDQEAFETIIDKYEKNKEENEQSLFLFCVTMQNHSGYDYEGDNFEYSITLKGYEKEYKDVEQYLSVIHETDKAVEYLIKYFEKEDREVVIVFYGDHHPALSEDFITEISDVDYDTIEERLRHYTVPFFIWGNYDIEERNAGMIGLNYLMNEVYQTIGMELSPYRKFLSEIRKIIPVMNRYTYYSLEEEEFKRLPEATGKEKETLDLYWRVQYNNMFDRRNRNESLFPLAK